MERITNNWMSKNDACSEAVEWVKEQNTRDAISLYKLTIKDNHLDWANWGLSRLFNRKQRIQYAVYAAKQVLHIFEEKHPDDKRPRQAIDAAIRCIDNNTAKNRHAAAYAAAYAAASAAASAYAYAYAAASAAAYAAASASADASADAYADAYAAAAAAREKMRKKILAYGIKLLGGKK